MLSLACAAKMARCVKQITADPDRSGYGASGNASSSIMKALFSAFAALALKGAGMVGYSLFSGPDAPANEDRC